MTEQTKETITINEVVYVVEDMSLDKKYMVSQLKDLQQKIAGRLVIDLDKYTLKLVCGSETLYDGSMHITHLPSLRVNLVVQKIGHVRELQPQLLAGDQSPDQISVEQ